MDERIAESKTLTTTALHTAAQSGDMNAVKDYLDSGGDIAALDAQTHTALYVAVEHRQWAIVEFLLANNADPFYPNGDTFLHHALRNMDTTDRVLGCWPHLTMPQQQELLHSFKIYFEQTWQQLSASQRVIRTTQWVSLVCTLIPHGADPFLLAGLVTQSSITELAYIETSFIQSAHAQMAHPVVLFRDFIALQKTRLTALSSCSTTTTIADTIADKKSEDFSSITSDTSTQSPELLRQHYFKLIHRLLQHHHTSTLGMSYTLMAISELHLQENHYLEAMRYAAGAFYYRGSLQKQCTSDALEWPFAKHIHRIIQQYLQVICSLKKPIRITEASWLHYQRQLTQHRERIRVRLPAFPAKKPSDIFSWLKENTVFFKNLTAKLFQEALKLHPMPPPCQYALIGLGSMARDEMCPYSDLECALVLERNTPEIQKHFFHVTRLFQLLITALGETYLGLLAPIKINFTPKGFHLDDAYNPLSPGMMGTVAELLVLQEWVLNENTPHYHTLWPQQHMLRQVCFLEGDHALAKKYQAGIQAWLVSHTQPISIWFSFLRTYETQGQYQALQGMKYDVDRNPARTEPIQQVKVAAAVSIKQALCQLPVQWVGYLALYYAIDAHSSDARILALHKSNKISPALCDELQHIISGGLHVRALAHVHYGEEREDGYFVGNSLLLDTEHTHHFLLPNHTYLHQLRCFLLALEATQHKFLREKGRFNLAQTSFADAPQTLSAQAYEQSYNFELAERWYRNHSQQQPDDLHARGQLIRFYATWHHTVIREWDYLKEQGDVWAKTLVSILNAKHATPALYIDPYRLLPLECRAAFISGITEIPTHNEHERLIKHAIMGSVKSSLQQDAPNTQQALFTQAQAYWRTQYEEADKIIILKQKSKALTQRYQPKKSEVRLERDQRELAEAEHQLAVYHTYLQHNTLDLTTQEVLYISLIGYLEKIREKQRAKIQDTADKLERSIEELINEWQKKNMPEKAYVAVYRQLTPTMRKLFRQKLLDHQDKHTTHQAFLLSLLTALNGYPDEDGQRADWLAHKQRWQFTLASLIEKSPQKTKIDDPSDSKKQDITSDDKIKLASPLLLQTHTESLEEAKSLWPSSQPQAPSTISGYTLQPRIAQEFIQDGRFIEHKIRGSQSNIVAVHTHVELPTKNPDKKTTTATSFEQILYVKEKPEMPGMSCFIELFHHQCIAHGASLSELVRITIHNKTTIPVLISEGIEGENFDDVLLNKPEKLAQLSHRHFSDLALMAMLTNPGDGKPANYILVQLNNGEYRLVSIDHDHALFPAFLIEPNDLDKKDTNGHKSDQSTPQLQVRSILFCLETMHQAIHPDAREDFCRLDAFQVLRKVLQQAQVQNEYYAKLFKEEEITALNKKGHSTIPIPIHKEDIIHLYQKMCRLQHYLRHYPNATLLQCLLQTEPRVGLAYQQALAEPIPPRDRLQKIGRYQCDKAGNQITSTRALFSRTLADSFLSKTDYLALDTFSPESGLAALDQLHHQQRHLGDIQAEVQRGEFRRFSHVLSMQDREIIICGDGMDDASNTDKTGLAPLQWQKLPVARQRALLDLMLKKPWQRLHLSDCEALNKEILYQFLQTSLELQELHLDRCTSREVNQLAVLLNNHTTLRILYMRGMPHLTAFQNVTLPVLETLVIERSSQLRTLNIIAPQLRVLRTKQCTKLGYIKTDSLKLHYLDCEENNTLTLENVLNLTRQSPDLIILKLTDSAQLPGGRLLSQHPFLFDFLRMFPINQHIVFWSQLVAILKHEDIHRYLATLTTVQKEQLYFKFNIVTIVILLLDQTTLTTKYHLTKSTRITVFRTILVDKPGLVTQNRLSILWDLCKDKDPDIQRNAIQAIAAILSTHPTFITHDSLNTLADRSKEDEHWLVRTAAVQGVNVLLQAHPTMLITQNFLNTRLILYKDIDRDIRKSAVQAVTTLLKAKSTFITQDLINTLWDHCKDKNWRIREATVQEVSTLLQAKPALITQDSLNKLLDLYQDTDKNVQIAATQGVTALLQAKPTSITKTHLKKFLSLCIHRNSSVKIAAVRGVTTLLKAKPTLITQDLLNTLLDLYKDKNRDVRRAAAQGVTAFLQANPTLITYDSFNKLLHLYKDKNCDVRRAAVQGVTALLQAKPTLPIQDYLNILMDHCKNKDWQVREVVVQGLTALLQTKLILITQDSLHMLLDLYKDQDSHVRRAAVQGVTALLQAKPTFITLDYLNELLGLCKDIDSDVRKAAAQGVTAFLQAKSIFITQDSINKLLGLCKDTDSDVRRAAVQGVTALLQAKPTLITQDSLHMLLDLYKDKNSNVREAAAQGVTALLQMHPTRIAFECINKLIILCFDPNPDVQETAVTSLSDLFIKLVPVSAETHEPDWVSFIQEIFTDKPEITASTSIVTTTVLDQKKSTTLTQAPMAEPLPPHVMKIAQRDPNDLKTGDLKKLTDWEEKKKPTQTIENVSIAQPPTHSPRSHVITSSPTFFATPVIPADENTNSTPEPTPTPTLTRMISPSGLHDG